MLNIDKLAAEYAQKTVCQLTVDKAENSAKKAENIITKTLGVLQENGIYASLLYLKAKHGEEGTAIVKEMLSLLNELPFGWSCKNNEVDTSCEAILGYMTDNVATDLERLIIAKEALEQMLIYARYGAKARD